MTASIAQRSSHSRRGRLISSGLIATGFILLLVFIGKLQQHLDSRIDRSVVQINQLAQLPPGEHLKPAMLGYHQLAADMLWLQLVQVIGKKQNTAEEYDWIYHALDVMTTLDPQYTYAYYVGGIVLTDIGNRPELSNKILEKGHKENPTVWNIPFLLGYNYYFLLRDSRKGAEYISRAAQAPGSPAYLPGLATRMYAEAGNPDTALVFLEARLRETRDPAMQEFYVNRMKQVMIERDIQLLEQKVEIYRSRYRMQPDTLGDLVRGGVLPSLPLEPFGGEYRLDVSTGQISSSTHPERLRTFDVWKGQTRVLYPRIQQPAYVFPKSWE